MKKPTRALESSVLHSLSLQLFTHFKKPNQKDKSFVSLSVPFLIFPPTKHILKNKKKKEKRKYLEEHLGKPRKGQWVLGFSLMRVVWSRLGLSFP
jgi:hypothetical protein